MSYTAYELLALSPLVVILVLLLGFQWPARRAMPAAFAVTWIVAVFAWRVGARVWMASIMQGLVVALEVIYIVFGAVLLLRTLEQSGAIDRIKAGFVKLSPDPRIQAIIVGWAFGSFIEGASGFGTPAVVVGPLLVALGFPAAAAITTGLIIQSTAVSFGAVGTPILIGVKAGLDNPLVHTEAAALGVTFEEYVRLIGARVAIIHGIIGLFMPLVLSMVLTRFFGRKRSWREGLQVWRIAVLAGVSFCLPYAVAAHVLGPEFPSLVGGLISLPITILAARSRWFRPSESWSFVDAPERTRIERIGPSKGMPLWLAWTPYGILTLLLVASRLPIFPLGEWLRSADLSFANVFGSPIEISTTPLYLPGTLLLLTSFITLALHKINSRQFSTALQQSAGNLRDPLITMAFVVPLVRIFINTGYNPFDMLSMPLLLADAAARLARGIWPLVAPTIGAVGAFFAGSNTFSNMMFSLFQFGVAKRIGVDPSIIVALQAVGGAAGNIVSIHNIVAASAVVGLMGGEGRTMRRVLVPLLYYLLAAGAIGLIATRVIDGQGG